MNDLKLIRVKIKDTKPTDELDTVIYKDEQYLIFENCLDDKEAFIIVNKINWLQHTNQTHSIIYHTQQLIDELKAKGAIN